MKISTILCFWNLFKTWRFFQLKLVFHSNARTINLCKRLNRVAKQSQTFRFFVFFWSIKENSYYFIFSNREYCRKRSYSLSWSRKTKRIFSKYSLLHHQGDEKWTKKKTGWRQEKNFWRTFHKNVLNIF